MPVLCRRTVRPASGSIRRTATRRAAVPFGLPNDRKPYKLVELTMIAIFTRAFRLLGARRPGLVFFAFAAVASAQTLPPGQVWRYTLLAGSILVDDCPICARPTVLEPMRGTS